MKLTNEGIAVIEGDAYLSQWIIDQGRLDVARDELTKYKQYIPKGGIVFDVGASLGDTAATFSEYVGPEGRVVAFEPNPETFRCLSFNMKNYHNVELFQLGLGNRNGLVGLVIDHHNIGASRLTLSGTQINVVKMDSYFSHYQVMSFLKIDAEGWEPWVLDGSRQTIERLRPVILIEVNTWPLGQLGFKPEDIWDRLSNLGYSFQRFDGPYGDVLALPL